MWVQDTCGVAVIKINLLCISDHLINYPGRKMRKNGAGVPVMFYRRARRPRHLWEIRPCLNSVYLGVKSKVQKQLSQEICHIFSMWLFNRANAVSWLVFLFWCKSQNESLVSVENSRILSLYSFRPRFSLEFIFKLLCVKDFFLTHFGVLNSPLLIDMLLI